MSRWLAYFLRIAMIIVGFIAGIASAALFASTLYFAGIGPDLLAESHMKIGILGAAAVMTSLYGYFSFVPAMAMVAVSEWSGRADWLSHALAGIALAVFIHARRNGVASVDNFDVSIAAIGVAASIVGASVYWALCGRRAGATIARYGGRSAEG